MKIWIATLNLILALSCLSNSSSAQISDAIVNNFNTEYSIKKDKLYKKVSLSITVYNIDGEGITHFRIPYSENTKIISLNARIEDSKGDIIRVLNKKEIQTYSAVSDFSLYEDDYIKYFVLRHNEYPYNVRVEYEIVYSEFLYVTIWDAVYRKNYPTSNALLSVTAPKDYQLNIKDEGIEEKEIQENSDEITYKWKSEYIKQYIEEPYSPPIQAIQSQVVVVPTNFYYGLPGSQKTWEELGEWEYNLLRGLQDLPDNEKALIDELIKNCPDDYCKIETLYKFLQKNARYINVTLGVGGLKPYPASYVARNKYGDCKALTNYMRTILSYAGIESYYTNIYAGSKINPIDTSTPAQQFNHVLLLTPLEDDTLWIECTSKNEPLGYVSPFIQNRLAFIIKDKESEFVKTPKLTATDVQTSTTYNVELADVGESKIQCTTNAKGNKYVNLNNFLKNSEKEEQDEFFRDFLPIRQYKLNSWEVLEQKKNAVSITTRLNASTNNLLKKYGDDYILKLFPAEIPKFTRPSERKNHVWIHYPTSSLDTIIYKIPPHLMVSQNSADKEINTRFGFYSIKLKVETNKIIAVRQFILKPGKYDLEEYKDFYNFISEVRDTDKKNVILLN